MHKMHTNVLAFSLLELLLVTSISYCILIIGLQSLIQLYVGSKKIQQILEVQNSILTARYNLNFDIMHAGFIGCHHPTRHNNVVNNVALNFDLNINHLAIASICNVNGLECSNLVTPSVKQLLNTKVIPPNTPVLILYNVPQNVANLTIDMQEPSDALTLNFEKTPHLNDILVINDCLHMDQFSVSNIYKHTLQHSAPNNRTNFSHTYRAGTLVFRPSIVAYYLRSTPQHKGKNFTLYRDDFQRNAVALISGITNFKVQIDANFNLQINLSFYHMFDTELLCASRNSKMVS